MIFKFNVFWSLFASGLAYIHLNNKMTQIRMLQIWPGIVQRQRGLSAPEQGASYIQRLKPCGSFLPSPPSAAVVWHMQCWKRTDPSVRSRALQLTTLRVFCYVTEGNRDKDDPPEELWCFKFGASPNFRTKASGIGSFCLHVHVPWLVMTIGIWHF